MIKTSQSNHKKNYFWLAVFCDGGARGNPGPAATGFLIKDKSGKVLVSQGKYIGKATNNIAEYQAVFQALDWIKDNIWRLKQDKLSINFYLDSLLVVNQLKGVFKIKNLKLKQLVLQIKSLENKIKNKIDALFFYHSIPRAKNFQADKLLNQALDQVKENNLF